MDFEQPAANPADAEPIADAAQTEANTPAVGDAETTEATAEESDELDKLAGISDAEPEAVEVEYEGKQYKLPPELKDAVLRHADYTRKTMDLSDKVKSFEAEREAFQQTANLAQEEISAVVDLRVLEAQISQYANIDWQAWANEDAAGAQAARWQYDELVRQRDGKTNSLAQYLQQRVQTGSQETAKLRQSAIEAVSREIPTFTEARRAELETTLETAFGAPKGIGSKITDPWEYRILHYADIGKKFVERQREAAKAKNAAKPANMVGGAAAAGQKSPDEMSPDEWTAYRNKQLARK